MSASTCFEYGGYHFFPLRRFNKGEGDFFALSKRLERDFSLGLFDYKDRQKFPYSYDEFYKVATNPNYDIYCCVENGKIYVPATHELFIYHNPNDYHKREQKIIKSRVLIDTKNQYFDLKEIDNRRFMYNTKTGILVLGAQLPPSRKIRGSHAEDLSNAGIYSGYDDYVRGWVGVGKDYPHGVIHFAPNVDDRNTELYNRAFDTLEMFAQNGAEAATIIRALGKRWEQPLFSILSDMEHKPSIHEQLKQKPEQKSVRHEQSTKKKEAEL